jgi:hypothetical protein
MPHTPMTRSNFQSQFKHTQKKLQTVQAVLFVTGTTSLQQKHHLRILRLLKKKNIKKLGAFFALDKFVCRFLFVTAFNTFEVGVLAQEWCFSLVVDYDD